MTALQARGWCPSLHEPMAAGDGLLVRVKPPLSRLSVAAARGLADAAARFGNGVLELTGRGNLQVRGLSHGSLGGFERAVVALGLADARPAAERVRNVAVSPLLCCDPAVAPGTGEIAAILADGLAHDERLHRLPGKFGFAVDGGGVLPVQASWADLALRARGETWLVVPQGSALAAAVPAARAAPAALALARAVLDLGEQRAGALAKSGRVSALFAASGLAPVPALGLMEPTARPGILPYGRAGRCAVLAGPRFGQLDPDDLAAVAALAESLGCDSLRLTPERLLALPSVRTDDAARASDALRGLGLVVDAADRAASITACQGAPRCANARRPARSDAARLAERLGDAREVHVSGCAKGCAHPGPAAFTLVGDEDGYALILGDTAQGRPASRGLSLEAAGRAIAGGAILS